MANFLEKHPDVGSFRCHGEDSDSLDLESFVCRKNPFRDFKARQVIFKLLSADSDFLVEYEKLVLETVVPAVKKILLTGGGGANEGDEMKFHYQFPPSIRLQPGPNELTCKKHNDLEYGHQIGEVNFWLPLTDYEKTQTTLWVEDEFNCDTFSPAELNYGEIVMFHGTLKVSETRQHRLLLVCKPANKLIQSNLSVSAFALGEIIIIFAEALRPPK